LVSGKGGGGGGPRIFRGDGGRVRMLTGLKSGLFSGTCPKTNPGPGLCGKRRGWGLKGAKKRAARGPRIYHLREGPFYPGGGGGNLFRRWGAGNFFFPPGTMIPGLGLVFFGGRRTKGVRKKKKSGMFFFGGGGTHFFRGKGGGLGGVGGGGGRWGSAKRGKNKPQQKPLNFSGLLNGENLPALPLNGKKISPPRGGLGPQARGGAGPKRGARGNVSKLVKGEGASPISFPGCHPRARQKKTGAGGAPRHPPPPPPPTGGPTRATDGGVGGRGGEKRGGGFWGGGGRRQKYVPGGGGGAGRACFG